MGRRDCLRGTDGVGYALQFRQKATDLVVRVLERLRRRQRGKLPLPGLKPPDSFFQRVGDLAGVSLASINRSQHDLDLSQAVLGQITDAPKIGSRDR